MLLARLRLVGGRSSAGDANVLAAASCETRPRSAWKVKGFFQAQVADAQQEIQHFELMSISEAFKKYIRLSFGAEWR